MLVVAFSLGSWLLCWFLEIYSCFSKEGMPIRTKELKLFNQVCKVPELQPILLVNYSSFCERAC